MRHPTSVLRGACACVLGTLLCTTLPTQAQTNGDAVVDPIAAKQQAREIAQGDPARWHRDIATQQAQLRNLRKEIGAALQEAKNACKLAPATERTACLKEAQATYNSDMAQVKTRVETQGLMP
jgi:hypothetical protein